MHPGPSTQGVAPTTWSVAPRVEDSDGEDQEDSSPQVSLPRLYYPLCAPALTPALCLEQTGIRFRRVAHDMAEYYHLTQKDKKLQEVLERNNLALERTNLALERAMDAQFKMQNKQRDDLVANHASEIVTLKLRNLIEQLELKLGKTDAVSRTVWWTQFLSSDTNPTALMLLTSILFRAFDTIWSSVTSTNAKQAKIKLVADAISNVYHDLSRCVHAGRSDDIVLVRDEHTQLNFDILYALMKLGVKQKVTGPFRVQPTRRPAGSTAGTSAEAPPASTPAAAPSQGQAQHAQQPPQQQQQPHDGAQGHAAHAHPASGTVHAQVGAHAAATPLPAGWASGTDPASGTTYYYNQGAGITQWDAPVGAVEAAGGSAGGRAGSVTQQQQPWQQQQWQQQQQQPQQQQWQHHQHHQHHQHQHQHQHQH